MTIRVVPYLLTLFRFVAGPVVLALAYGLGHRTRYACVMILALGVLSDIFDGVIARRIGCATPSLRRLDSRADVVFWTSIILATLTLCPTVRSSLVFMTVTLFCLELIPPTISVMRFRQEASTHHWLSKIFGLGLWLLATMLFLHGEAMRLQLAVFALGIVSQLEAILIMLVIPAWQTDIRGIAHALQLRKQALRNFQAIKRRS